MNVGVCGQLRSDFTQFLHSSERHLFAYSGIFIDTCRDDRPGRSMRQGSKMEGMLRTARVVTWNGRDVPAELRELPAGRYVVEAIDDDAPALSPDEEAGIEAALESYRQGRIVDAKRARQIIDAALGRRRSPTPK